MATLIGAEGTNIIDISFSTIIIRALSDKHTKKIKTK